VFELQTRLLQLRSFDSTRKVSAMKLKRLARTMPTAA